MTSLCSVLVATNLCCTDNFKFSILRHPNVPSSSVQNASKLIPPPQLLFYFSLSDLVNSNLLWRSFCKISTDEINTLYILNVYNVMHQLYLNKAQWGEVEFMCSKQSFSTSVLIHILNLIILWCESCPVIAGCLEAPCFLTTRYWQQPHL